MKRVLIMDDHEIVKTGLRIFLNKLMPDAVVDDTSEENDALKKVADNAYDLVLLDINIPGSDSFGVAGEILNLRPQTNILVFSMSAESVYAKKYLALGARGYISKNATEDELTKAIHIVMKGELYISAALTQLLVEEHLGKKPMNPFDELSARELEIFQRLMSGEKNTNICSSLGLTPSTIGTYKGRMFKKLNCKNIIELNSLAKFHGMLAN
ncbi:MAG: response regulator transcription factor [Ferruginibacter sp.]